MSEYFTKGILADNATPVAVDINKTSYVVSAIEQLEKDDSRDLFVVAEVVSVSGTGGVIKLQQCHRKDGTFADVSGASVTITAAGTFVIKYNKIDGSGDALYPYVRLVATTGGSDAFTINRLMRTRRN